MHKRIFTTIVALCTLLVLPATLLLAAHTHAPLASPTPAYAPQDVVVSASLPM